MATAHQIPAQPKLCRAGLDPLSEARKRFKTFCFFPDEYESILTLWEPLKIKSVDHDSERLRLRLGDGTQVFITNTAVTWESPDDWTPNAVTQPKPTPTRRHG